MNNFIPGYRSVSPQTREQIPDNSRSPIIEKFSTLNIVEEITSDQGITSPVSETYLGIVGQRDSYLSEAFPIYLIHLTFKRINIRYHTHIRWMLNYMTPSDK